MAKSIMHKKDGTCYLCMMLNGDYDDHKVTEEHHAVFGVQNRTRAERWGLKVYLCPYHHRTSKEAVHKNYKNARFLQEKAQQAFEKFHPELSWMKEFGRNYIQSEPDQAEKVRENDTSGFIPLEEESEDEKIVY